MLAALALTAILASANDGKMYVSIGPDGTPVVTDYPRDHAVKYSPGDFEKIAMNEKGVPHRGLAMDDTGFGGPPVVIELHEHSSSSPQRRAGAPDVPAAIEKIIDEASAKYGVAVALVRAVVAVESGFRNDAVSHAGAQGLMQLMPDTAADLGVRDPFDAHANVFAGTRYLAFLLKHFKDEALAVAAYNAGPARVAREGAIPDIPETKAYVESVLGLRRAYEGMLR